LGFTRDDPFDKYWYGTDNVNSDSYDAAEARDQAPKGCTYSVNDNKVMYNHGYGPSKHPGNVDGFGVICQSSSGSASPVFAGAAVVTAGEAGVCMNYCNNEQRACGNTPTDGIDNKNYVPDYLDGPGTDCTGCGFTYLHTYHITTAGKVTRLHDDSLVGRLVESNDPDCPGEPCAYLEWVDSPTTFDFITVWENTLTLRHFTPEYSDRKHHKDRDYCCRASSTRDITVPDTRGHFHRRRHFQDDDGTKYETHPGIRETNDPDSTGHSDSYTDSFYDFGKPIVGVAGSFYRVCWGHDPKSIAEYRFQVDYDFTLVGPNVDNVECTLGVPCNIEVEQVGWYWSTGVVVLLNGSCGDADPEVAVWRGTENPSRLHTALETTWRSRTTSQTSRSFALTAPHMKRPTTGMVRPRTSQ
jgi:hypothetical protein